MKGTTGIETRSARKLYVTHNIGELLMAFVQAECCGWSLYMAIASENMPFAVRVIFAHLVIGAGILTYAFLFCCSGSRERQRDAERAQT